VTKTTYLEKRLVERFRLPVAAPPWPLPDDWASWVWDQMSVEMRRTNPARLTEVRLMEIRNTAAELDQVRGYTRLEWLELILAAVFAGCLWLRVAQAMHLALGAALNGRRGAFEFPNLTIPALRWADSPAWGHQTILDMVYFGTAEAGET